MDIDNNVQKISLKCVLGILDITQKLADESREVDSRSANVRPDRNQRIIVAIWNNGDRR
jgi:hypothetical protein